MAENSRDTGLIRAVGTWGFAASTINAVIGASIFVVPATLAASLGYYAPIALLACAIAIGCIAVCFAEGGSRVPTSGGAYGYIEAAFGPMAGYVSGAAPWFSNILASNGIAAVIALAIAGIALVNLTAATRGAQLINTATLLKSYGIDPKPPEQFTGKLFRTFSQSHLLDFTKQTTYASDEYSDGVLQQYEIACLNHVIDVVCAATPKIIVTADDGSGVRQVNRIDRVRKTRISYCETAYSTKP